MKIKSSVIKYGNNINTDTIISAKYLNTSDEKILSQHCLETLDREFNKKVKTAKILVVGKNFGCGSSREHAPLAIKSAGIKCIIAKSFGRIFFRNAVNIGLPVVESISASKGINRKDRVEIDLTRGGIRNLSSKKVYRSQPYPEFLRKIILSGGLVNYVKQSKKER